MRAGSPPGIVNTSYQVGSALGLAAMTAVAAANGADQARRPGRPDRRLPAALAGAALIAVSGAVASLALVRRRRPACVEAPPQTHAGQPA